MTGLDLWLKITNTNSFFDKLTVAEAKLLKDYLYGKLSLNKAASNFVKNFNLEPICNLYF